MYLSLGGMLVLLGTVQTTAFLSPPNTVPHVAALHTGLKFDEEVGTQPPLFFFDPLGLLKDNQDYDTFDRLRYTELKHGRISMLAVVGYLVQEADVRLPGCLDKAGTVPFAAVPNGFAAFNAIPGLGVLQIVAFIGFLEAFVMKDATQTGEFVGDFRNEVFDFGWDTFDPDTQFQKREIELNNGRAAMMGILALMVHEQLGVSILLW